MYVAKTSPYPWDRGVADSTSGDSIHMSSDTGKGQVTGDNLSSVSTTSISTSSESSIAYNQEELSKAGAKLAYNAKYYHARRGYCSWHS